MKNILFITTLLLFAGASVLAQGKTEKLTGQVVCSLCWFEEEDRKATPYGNAADITCAEECSEKNVSQSLAVKDEKGEFQLYELQRGAFKLKAKDFLEFVPKTVEIEGEISEKDGKKAIRVNSLKVVKVAAAQVVQSDAALALNDLSGAAQDIKSYKGRVVVLNFWATWCKPCKEEMPDLAAIQSDYGAMGVQVIGAAADETKGKAKVMKFIKEMKVNFPIWMELSNAQMDSFGVGHVLPATVIINREGKTIWRKVGKIDAKELRAELDKLLAAKLETAALSKATKKDKGSLVPA